jgi:hypothetical protein
LGWQTTKIPQYLILNQFNIASDEQVGKGFSKELKHKVKHADKCDLFCTYRTDNRLHKQEILKTKVNNHKIKLFNHTFLNFQP